MYMKESKYGERREARERERETVNYKSSRAVKCTAKFAW